jgi:hypothetical protein
VSSSAKLTFVTLAFIISGFVSFSNLMYIPYIGSPGSKSSNFFLVFSLLSDASLRFFSNCFLASSFVVSFHDFLV